MSFHAGFASDTGHKLVELLARQVQAGRLESALPFAKLFYWVARALQPLLSDSGGMYMRLEGLDIEAQPQQLTWTSAGQRESWTEHSLRPGDRTDQQDRRGLRAAGGRAGLHGPAVASKKSSARSRDCGSAQILAAQRMLIQRTGAAAISAALSGDRRRRRVDRCALRHEFVRHDEAIRG